MNVINQATNYLKVEGKTDLLITVNITCMMVLTSVYLSVSSTLPSTLRIKPVEIWLLVNLAFPFLVIISNIVLEVLFLLWEIKKMINLLFTECREQEKGNSSITLADDE